MKFLLSLIMLTAFSASAENKPPKVFVDKGACPFECCTYREWGVQKDTKLYSAVGSSKVVAEIKKGTKIKAVTGEVHVHPTPMKVVYKHKDWQVGETVFLLTYEGEGYQKVWRNGKVTSEEVMFLYNLVEKDKTCKKPRLDCWGSLTGKQKSEWWIKFELPGKKTGWSKESKNFINTDACG